MFNSMYCIMSFNLLTNLLGFYKGNVVNSRVGWVAKTGHIEISSPDPNYLTIACESILNERLTTDFERKELIPYFEEKKTSVILKNGDQEDRVAFKQCKDDNYGLFNQWFKGATMTCVACQLKFINGKLNAARVQEYNTAARDKLTYLLELKNLSKLEQESKPEPNNKDMKYQPLPKKEPNNKDMKYQPLPKKEVKPAMKTDWDF